MYRELARSIKFDKAAILLAVYRSEFVRADVEKRLAARLDEAGQQVARLFINEQHPDLPAYLRRRADERRTVFFVSGLRFGGGRDGRAAYRALNIRREYFIDYRLRVVFWITEEEERELPRRAPDFWAFRHRVIPFLDDPTPEQMEQHAHNLAWREWQGDMLDRDPAFTQDTAAKIAYRERLLAELPETPQMDRARRDLLYTLAPLYRAQNNYDHALALCEQVLTLDPEDATAYNSRGNTHRKMGEYDDALADYDRAIALDPQYATAYYNRGNTHRKMGEYDDALADYDRAIALDPEDATAYNNRGLLYGKMGDYAAAAADYERVIDLNPEDTDAHLALARIYRHLGQQDAYAAQVAQARPLLAQAGAYSRACFAAICDEVEEAVALLAQALEEDPSMKTWAREDPDFAFIRRDPRYRALVGLEEATTDTGKNG